MKQLKYIFCFLFVTIASNIVVAQDMIVTNDGTIIKAKVTKVGATEVEYKKWTNQDGPIYTVKVSNLIAINYQNGEKDTFSNFPSNSQQIATAKTQNTGNVQVTVESLSPEARAANETIMTKLNAPVELVYPEKHKEDIGKKDAGAAYIVYGLKRNSVISNEDIEIIGKIGCLSKINKNAPAQWKEGDTDPAINKTNPAIKISIRNKSDKILFIDLGTTYIGSMGNVTCYYVPSSTSSSHGTSGGASINLGSVAGAIGIGGAISTLANGINVGGGSSNSTVSTTYSQRIISIPPKSTIDLAPQYLFGNEIKKICEGAYLELFSNMSYIFIPKLYFNKKAGRMLVGDHYKYTEDNSPIQFNFIMSYSYDDSCASTKTLSAYFYMRDLMGFYSTNWSLVDRGRLPSDFVGLSSWVYVKSWNVTESFPKQ
ncbi:hypothetical protein [Segatella copri]|uniref:Uncharacterized protein n=1 Tax=Segatella copri TaxID=165179 RepID=A0AAW4N5G1_9BACT|nr:hypothetical protein [Segatella copri]MBV3388943.1 hypothetical protein [Segatella copri]MBV3396746.1 hypothetical protein [Segatella copri]MBV3406350.1 hypothetical protein [Segatella copri]